MRELYSTIKVQLFQEILHSENGVIYFRLMTNDIVVKRYFQL